MNYTKIELEILKEVEKNLAEKPGRATNPTTNKTVILDEKQMTLYEYILGCVLLEDETEEFYGVNLFRKLYPEKYDILFEGWY